MAEISQLRAPRDGEMDWQLSGTCRRLDPEAFFHPEGARGRARQSREDAAKQICSTCPVLRQCREYALAKHEPYGVWGGMTEGERLAHAHNRQAREAS